MKGNRLFRAIVLLSSITSPGLALDLVPTVSAIHQLESNFHNLGYGLSATVPLKPIHIRFSFGLTHPYAAHGFRQQLFHGDISAEWRLKWKFMTFFTDIGAGAWVDQVSTGSSGVSSLVPSVVFRGGVRAGSSAFGAEAAIEDYTGIYNPDQLPFTVWFLFNFRIGLYVAL